MVFARYVGELQPVGQVGQRQKQAAAQGKGKAVASGRFLAILLGLEFLVAADIIRTVDEDGDGAYTSSLSMALA